MQESLALPDERASFNHPSHVVVALGSLGDILPLAAIAKHLQDQGHRVWFLAPANFKHIAQLHGLEFHAILAADKAHAILENPLLWQPRHSISIIWPGIFECAQQTVWQLEALAAQGARPHLIGGTMALGIRVAHERWGWEHTTIHVSPCWTFSSSAPPVFHALAWLKNLPMPWRKKVWAWIGRKLLDPICADEFNAWRATHRLQPVHKVLSHWASSPQRIIGLYPAWFAPPQSDWPRQLHLSNFTLNEGAGEWRMPEELTHFLGAPKKTVLVMAGSHMLHATRLFESMAEVCAKLDLQALFIAPQAIAQRPWPAHVQVHGYAPLSHVLPHCAALISHPGVGTIAQAMRCGTPMLLTPYAFDHHDNAQRAVRLGIAQIAAPTSSSASLAKRVHVLLKDPQIASACRTIQTNMPQAEATQATIYELLHRSLH